MKLNHNKISCIKLVHLLYLQIISIIIFNNHFNLNILDHVNYRSNKHSKKEESSMNKKDMKNNGSGYPSIMWVKKQNL